jgi:hypothetical protein
MIGPLPEILEQPLIPPPLHGLNPRTIMGRAKWDVVRRQIYRKYAYSCAACGVKARDAKIKKNLEAHESFEIDYAQKQMTLKSMEPLCHACHAFVHSGLLEVRLASQQVSKETVAVILGHGVGVLAQSGGKMPPASDHLCRKLGLSHGLPVSAAPRATSWSGWSMRWDGEVYPALYNTQADWQRAMSARNVW